MIEDVSEAPPTQYAREQDRGWQSLQEKIAFQSGLMSCSADERTTTADQLMVQARRASRHCAAPASKHAKRPARSVAAKRPNYPAGSCEALVERVAHGCLLAPEQIQATLSESRFALRARTTATPGSVMNSSLGEMSDEELERLERSEAE